MKCLQFKLHLCVIHHGTGAEQQRSAGTICHVCSVPINNDDLGYSEENYRSGSANNIQQETRARLRMIILLRI